MDAEAIRKYGVEPDFEHYTYEESACSWCGQPVLIIQSKERIPGFRTAATACEHCMSKMTRRTRAKDFRWVFLPGWRPEQR